MTWGGGKPHAVGDRGQRYSVSYEREDGVRRQFGWSATLEGAHRMCASIDLNPDMCNPQIFDRETTSLVEVPK